MQEDTIGIPNAKWWLAHSTVLVREDLLAEDSEWIGNQSTQVINPGTPFARIEARLGSANLLLVKRMVVQGVVAVRRANDRIKTVNLPQDAHKLLAADLDYIASQIQELNKPMTEEEQTDFLAGANGHSEGTLQVVK